MFSATKEAMFSASLAAIVAMGLSSVGCGGTSRPEIVPTLPGDGNRYTAKPQSLPAEDKEDRGDPWADSENLIEPPAAKTARAIELPAIERFKLRNGLSVIAVKDDKLPLVSMKLAIKAGRLDTPRDKMGLATFTAAMLTTGTRFRSADRIASDIDFVGGSLSATADLEVTMISCAVQAGNLRTCLSLVPDILVNSNFPAPEIERIRRKLHVSLRHRRDNAGQLASAHLQNLLWGYEHVRGWPASARTVDAIKRSDLVNWHRRWFAPNNAVLLVAGAVDGKKLRFQLEQAFRWWYQRKVPQRTKYPDPIPCRVKIRLVDKPGQPQSYIYIGQLGISHRDPAYFDHVAFDYVLGGGGFSSRLFQVVRAKGGKGYEAWSAFDRHLTRGALVASTVTRSTETVATVDLVLKELAKMKQRGPTAQELAGAISHLVGSYAIRFESATDVGDAILRAELHGLGIDYVRNYPLQMAKVTVESARQAAAATLDPKNVAIVIVGDGKVVEPQLTRIGVPYETVGHLEPVAGYERAAAAFASVDPKSVATGRALLDRAVQAKGGLARLTRLRNMALGARGKNVAGSQELQAQFVRRYVVPDKLRLDIDIEFQGRTIKALTILNGKRGWKRDPRDGVAELSCDEINELHDQLWRDPEFILLRHRDEGTGVESLGAKSFEGGTFNAVRVTRADGKAAATLYFDQKTHLLAHMTYREKGIETTESHSDYKRVGGVQIAHRRLTSSPNNRLELEVTSATLDQAMDLSLFSQPQ